MSSLGNFPHGRILPGALLISYMALNPGFAGQKFLPEILPKIETLRRLCEARGLEPWIAVDGGQDAQNAARTVAAGADAIIAGSAIFGSTDYAAAIAAIRRSATREMRAAP